MSRQRYPRVQYQSDQARAEKRRLVADFAQRPGIS